jgi:hypothetical protein
MRAGVPDGVVEIGLHKLEDQIEVLVIFCADHIVQFDDVRVVEFMQEHNFAIGPLRIGGVLEGIEYLFKRENLSSFFVGDFPDMSIGTTA